MTSAVIAFGSNLDEPTHTVRCAIASVLACAGIHEVGVSSLYRTAPVGYLAQPDFINAVALVETHMTAHELLTTLQHIEQQFGRTRHFRNAPRTLDLDIIDYGGCIQNDAVLQLPHPRAHERGFVLWPLAEIAPDYVLGTHGRVMDLAMAVGDGGIERLMAS